jgi:hypothetical protein
LAITPAPLEEAHFAVRLRQEDNLEPSGFAVVFKQGFDVHKIWLVPMHTTYTALCVHVLAFEVFALALETISIDAALFQDPGHASRVTYKWYDTMQ